jgi:DNA-binding NarL/FixJ family response regulator
VRVVIADDHRIVREGVRWMLQDEPDIEVVGEAQDGEALLDLLARETPDVVLLDVRMPGLGGLEALERMERSSHGPRVIVLSMLGEPGYVRRAIELGAAGYLLKSTTREELVNALRAVADGHGYVQGEVSGTLLAYVTEQPAGDELVQLTQRELDVMKLTAEGLANKQIARRLRISEATVKTHLKDIFERLGVSNRAEAVATAMRLGMIE